MSILHKKIIETLTFCDFCYSNSHKLRDCLCNEFIKFKTNCDNLKNIFNLDIHGFKKWLLVYHGSDSKLLYYFALSKCNMPSRFVKKDSTEIINKIAEFIYHVDSCMLGDYLCFNKSFIVNSPLHNV
jgi:hypothetical protein